MPKFTNPKTLKDLQDRTAHLDPNTPLTVLYGNGYRLIALMDDVGTTTAIYNLPDSEKQYDPGQ